MNYFPFHIGDYLSATRHLSWEEDMAYRRLLDVYYTTEKPIPSDHKQACRLVLATTESQREAVQTVLNEFFEATELGWINSRADAEIEAMREKQQKQRDRANKRWQKPDAEHGNALAMPQHNKSDATASISDASALPPTPTPTPTPKEKKPTASSPAKLPTCPASDLIDLYHSILPSLPAVRLETESRKRALRKVWDWVLTSKKGDGTPRATNAKEALDWFRSYFERASENDFLMGRTPRTGEHQNWKCDLDFLLTERGMKHVIERTTEHA